MSNKSAAKSMMGEAAPVKIIIKKKKSEGGHHGGVWKVAYADFITALMALFLLLWLIGSASDEQKKAIAGYFRDDPVAMPGESSPGTGILEGTPNADHEAARLDSMALAEARLTLETMFRADGPLGWLSDHVLVQLTDEGLQLDIVDKASNVLFDVGSSQLKPAAVEVLTTIAGIIKSLDNKIVLGGHTDSRPFAPGASFSNWELSTERASRARHVMAQAGMAESHLAQVAGYADTRPLLPDDPEAPANRRISLTVLRKKLDPARLDREKTSGLEQPEGPDSSAAPVRSTIDPGINKHLEFPPGEKPEPRGH